MKLISAEWRFDLVCDQVKRDFRIRSQHLLFQRWANRDAKKRVFSHRFRLRRQNPRRNRFKVSNKYSNKFLFTNWAIIVFRVVPPDGKALYGGEDSNAKINMTLSSCPPTLWWGKEGGEDQPAPLSTTGKSKLIAKRMELDMQINFRLFNHEWKLKMQIKARNRCDIVIGCWLEMENAKAI